MLCGALASCAAPVALIGGAGSTLNPELDAKLARVAQQGESGRYIREGITALSAGDSATATRAINRAIMLSPDNPQLHVLNAIAYHLGYSQGIHVNRDLAETGYLVALRLDPNNLVAADMLGQLYLETRRYDDARRWLARSLLLGQASARAYHSFAIASYYTNDMPLALWAITQAEQLEDKSPPIVRAGTLIRAAAGEFQAAEERQRIYDTVETDALLKRNLAQRVAQWRTTLANAVPAPVQLAQAPKPFVAPAQQNVLPAANVPLAPSWSDCAPGTGPASGWQPAASGNTGYADETLQIPALPSPCAGRPLPRMAVIDVAIVRSQDVRSTSKGVNLLDSLSVTLGGDLLDYQRTFVADRFGRNSADSRQYNRGFKISLPTASITYSLNIANARDVANEVISRPSLVVLDRQPSTFFAGSNASTVAASSLVSGGQRVDHPTGVSLSVTPTFIDDDSMLLSVKAGRSFFQDPGNVNLAGTVLTTRNMATANVRIRFNETLVLSGLNERETQESESGVPVLKEVPGLQYLFKTETIQNFTQTLLVLVTPRRPEAAGAQETTTGQRPAEVDELRTRAAKGWKLTPNLNVTIAQLESRTQNRGGLFGAFRSGDLDAQVWHRPAGLQGILSEIASFLYY